MSLTQLSAQLKAALENRFPVESSPDDVQPSTESFLLAAAGIYAILKMYGGAKREGRIEDLRKDAKKLAEAILKAGETLKAREKEIAKLSASKKPSTESVKSAAKGAAIGAASGAAFVAAMAAPSFLSSIAFGLASGVIAGSHIRTEQECQETIAKLTKELEGLAKQIETKDEVLLHMRHMSQESLEAAELEAACESLVQEIDELIVVTKHYSLEAEGAADETDKKALHIRAWEAIKKMVAKIMAFFKRIATWVADFVRKSQARAEGVLNRIKAKHFEKTDVVMPANLAAYIGDSLKLPDFGPFKDFMNHTAKFFNGASGFLAHESNRSFKDYLRDIYGTVSDGWEVGVHGNLVMRQTSDATGKPLYIPAATIPNAFDIRVIAGEPKHVELPEAKETTLTVTKAQIESYLSSANKEMRTCADMASAVTTASDRVDALVAKHDQGDVKREQTLERLKQMLTFMSRAGSFTSKALQVMQSWHNATVRLGSLVLGEDHAIESLDGGGLPTEPVKEAVADTAAAADKKADAEGKTEPAVQSATPEHVSSQEDLGGDGDVAARAAVDAAPVVDEAAVANPEGGEKIVEVADDHAPEQNAEDALLAVNDASAAIDSSMRESTELEDAAAGLESILSSIAEYPLGLSPKDAEFVNVNLESIVGDWGLGQKLCPSIESFGGTNLRREATASLEANVREVLKSVYDYVVEMFKKFGELIANFYMQLFNASKAVARRGEALTQRVAGIQVDTPTKNVVDIGSLAGRLTINGQMPSLTAAMGAVMMEIESALELENHVQAIESAVGSAAAHLRGLKDDTFSAGFEEVSTAYLSATKAPPIFAANGEVLQTRVFPGEISYVAEQKEGHWRFRVVKTGKEPQGSVIHVPSKGDLSKLGDRLKNEGQKAGASIKAISDRIKTDKGQRFLAQIQGPSNNLNDENQRAIAKFVQQCAEDVKAIHALGKEMLTNSAKSMLAIVRVGEISCDLYKAPKAEAAPAAAKAEGEAPAAPAAGEGGEAPAAA